MERALFHKLNLVRYLLKAVHTQEEEEAEEAEEEEEEERERELFLQREPTFRVPLHSICEVQSVLWEELKNRSASP